MENKKETVILKVIDKEVTGSENINCIFSEYSYDGNVQTQSTIDILMSRDKKSYTTRKSTAKDDIPVEGSTKVIKTVDADAELDIKELNSSLYSDNMYKKLHKLIKTAYSDSDLSKDYSIELDILNEPNLKNDLKSQINVHMTINDKKSQVSYFMAYDTFEHKNGDFYVMRIFNPKSDEQSIDTSDVETKEVRAEMRKFFRHLISKSDIVKFLSEKVDS